jgi:hypothetical protein
VQPKLWKAVLRSTPRLGPLADDDGPLHKNPHQVEECHYSEDYASHQRNVRASMSDPPSFVEDSSQAANEMVTKIEAAK